MSQPQPFRVGVMGCGFWAQFQIAAWHELPGVQVVALYNRTVSKAHALGERFGVPSQNIFGDPAAMLDAMRGQIDVVDIITDVDTHAVFTTMAAERKIPVICQKPMASSLEQARAMVAACDKAGVPLFIHENWRWQTPVRALADAIKTGGIGKVFRVRIDMISGFPVIKNQPFLAELEQFILTDLGSHILDAARYLCGEAKTVFCRTQKTLANIKGENVATIVLGMQNGGTVNVNLAYAQNPLLHDRFPEAPIFVEAENGSARLDLDHWISVTTASGTHVKRVAPPRYPWADPAYDVVHSSIVPCNRNILGALRDGQPAETTGADNLKTVELVFACYESAARQQVIQL